MTLPAFASLDYCILASSIYTNICSCLGSQNNKVWKQWSERILTGAGAIQVPAVRSHTVVVECMYSVSLWEVKVVVLNLNLAHCIS